ncbi:MAG: agmatinase [SAR324 cluster bacterium]|nr:agmatinase [SAR324 cluster bacterium]MCZ6532283.1 agmatinase [SAR324 cluster bacterium]MCZ6558708.1 agmatinase [SAR324 cluster bacterium]MCZ6629345.1 agmatinase [SAR324 cluster bacterium]MCZ6645892.1 agmatinase [SAR324 cluster bacterium]
MGRYRPTSPEELPKFAGVRTFMRMPHVRTLEDVNFVVVGIPFDDATTFRSGARFGPEGIRSISAMIRPWHPVHDIDVFEHLSGVDYGDVAVVPGDVEATCEKTARDFQAIAAAGVTSFAMGGDHSVTLGELRGLCAVHGPLALVHFDAHVDTSEGNYGRKYDHGTPFRRAAEEKLVETSRSIQIGIRGGRAGPEYYQQSRDMGYEVIAMHEFEQLGVAAVLERIHKRVGDMQCFITIDIDAVDPAYAPGTGTPEVGGFTSREILNLVRGLKGLNIKGGDVLEVIPAIDTGEITAYLAANLLYEMICLQALAHRGG